MIDANAIKELQTAIGIEEASGAVSSAFNEGQELLALPNHFKLHELEEYMPTRRRARGTLETSNIESFAKYVAAHQSHGATVFVSHKIMAATALLNLGTPENPGHGDNRAKVNPDMTAAYTALRHIAQGQALEQGRVAEFLEDWQSNIQCFKGDISEPVQLKHAISAVRNITIEGLRKVEASEQQLSSSRSTFEAVTASSKDPMPTLIHFTCVPYHGFESRIFIVRLGIRTSDSKPALTLRIINSELHNEEMAEELAAKVRNAIGEACPVLIGDYTIIK